MLLIRSMSWLVLAAAVFVPLEWLFPIERQASKSEPGTVNIAWYFLNSLVTVPLMAVPFAWLAHAISVAGPFAWIEIVEGLPLWARMILAMVVGEFGFYWGHRWSHEWAWLWRFHAVHHSARELTFLVNARQHPFDMLFTRACGLVLLIVAGLVSPTAGGNNFSVAFVLLVGSLWSYFVHANVRWRLRPLTWVLATPLFHHWHHDFSDNRGSNFAAMLPAFDRLFGTYRLPDNWPEKYGTSTAVPTNLASQLVAPLLPEPKVLS